MGQRTQVILIKESKDGSKEAKIFHHQWGIGATMFLHLAKEIIESNKNHGKEIDFNGLDINDEFLEGDFRFTLHNTDLDITKIDDIKQIFSRCDNNNGGCVIQIKENKTQDNIEFGFLFGCEDVGEHRAFEEYIPNEEWFNCTSNGYLLSREERSEREEFIKAFNDFINENGVVDYAKTHNKIKNA